MNTKAWHYTTTTFLTKIFESGELRPTNSAELYPVPLLWFSANQKWEPMAATLFNRSPEHTNAMRFGLSADDERLLNWKESCLTFGGNRKYRRKVEKIAKKHGSIPCQWCVTTESIPLAQLHFQIWRLGVWAYVNDAVLAAWGARQIRPKHRRKKMTRLLHLLSVLYDRLAHPAKTSALQKRRFERQLRARNKSPNFPKSLCRTPPAKSYPPSRRISLIEKDTPCL